MGGKPKKALRESDLVTLTAGAAVKDSSHQTYRVQFIENGQTKKGFYKKLAPHDGYPELLLLMSVAMAFFNRMSLGKRSAEERIVVDDDGKIVGSLSIAIDEFRPLNFADEPVPKDEREKELVIPSTKTLIEKNFMELMISRWFGNDDDGHPHNYSMWGVIDHDMFWYWFVIYMKGVRPGIGVPNTRINLTPRDWEDFPCIVDAKPYHHPAYNHPGENSIPAAAVVPTQVLKTTLPKAYPDPLQFRNLAKSPEAHEQKFAAALKILLTYQPVMFRARLTELFGDRPLNYTSLDSTSPVLRAQYEKEFPSYCNSETNKAPFIEFIMKMYQEHYDEAYRTIVFYMGNTNRYGVRLQGTHEELRLKPSFYQNIRKWVDEQNKTLYINDAEPLKYNLDELEKRYHQVWRDSFAPTVKELLHGSYRLTNKLFQEVSDSAPMKEIKAKVVTDDSLTNVWDFIGAVPELNTEKIKDLILVDKKSELRDALILLVDFTKKFNAIVTAYYVKKDHQNLSVEDNVSFCKQLSELHETYNYNIRAKLAFTGTNATEFAGILDRLETLKSQVNFRVHLMTNDDQMRHSHGTNFVKETLPATHPEVLKQYNSALFVWAKGLNRDMLESYIRDVVDKQYTPMVGFLANRHRAKPVKEYLAASQYDSGDNRLAYILSSGKEDGTLNTLLIKHLTHEMLKSQHLPSIKKAIQDQSFDKDMAIFSKSVIDFAKENKQFVHLYNSQCASTFQNAVFSFVKKLDSQEFIKLIKTSLQIYEGGLSYATLYGGKSRRSEVMGYIKQNKDQAKILALTFNNGSDKSTLNEALLNEVMKLLKIEYNKQPNVDLPEYKLIMQYNGDDEEHKKLCTKIIKDGSVHVCHEQETISLPL